MDAKKSIRFAQQLNLNYIGVIENMLGFFCPHCRERIDIFKTAGTKYCFRNGSRFLSRIPYDIQVMRLSDDGHVYLKDNKNGQHAKARHTTIYQIKSLT